MKHMKKKLVALLLAACSAFTLVALSACTENGQSTGVKGDVTVNVESVIFTAKSDVTALTDTTTVKDYLDVLAANGELVFDGTEGEYGFFLQSFYSTENKTISSTANSYEGYSWAFYIDFITLDGDDAIYASDYQTYTHGDKTLYSASYGVSGIPCIAGHTYAFVYEYSNLSW